MSYAGKTKWFHIPFPKTGNVIRERDEQERMQIIDSQLYGAIRAHSGGHGIIREGTFSTAGTSVYLSSLDCFIDQIFAYSDDTVVWHNLTSGLNYLFIVTNSETLETGDVDTIVSTSPNVPAGGLLIATAISTGSSISSVDAQPSGIIMCPDWETHIAEDTNPHGSVLNQDEIIVSGLTVLESMDVNQLIVDVLRIRQQLVVSGLLVDSLVANDFYADDLYVHNLEGQNAQFSGTTILNELVVTSGITFGGGHLQGDLRVDSDIKIDGVDISVLKTDFDSHAVDTNNPHQVNAVQAQALPISGGTMHGNVHMLSGLTVDGIDLSELNDLINGSNADDLHTHEMSGVPFRYLMYAPEGANCVLSGLGSGIMCTGFDVVNWHNHYCWWPYINSNEYAIIQRIGVPEDFATLTEVRFWHRSQNSQPFSGAKIRLEMFNTSNAKIIDTGWVMSGAWAEKIIGLSSGLGTLGSFATTIFSMSALSGEAVCLGEWRYTYDTIHAG